MALSARLWGLSIREGLILEPVARGCLSSVSSALGLTVPEQLNHTQQPSSASSSSRHLSSSTCTQAKFQSNLRKRGTTSRLYTRENLREWRLSQYDVRVGAQLVDNALAGAGRARQRDDYSLNIEALHLIMGVSNVQQLRQVVVEVGTYLDSFCLVSAISRLPRLARSVSSGPTAPGSLWQPTQLLLAKEQQQLAQRVADWLLPLLQPKLGELTPYQVGMIMFALGELSYPLHPDQQASLLPAVSSAVAADDLNPRTAAALMLGCAKLGLPAWSPATWNQVLAAGARCAESMTLQQLVQALKALCVASSSASQSVEGPTDMAATQDVIVQAASARILEFVSSLSQPGSSGATGGKSAQPHGGPKRHSEAVSEDAAGGNLVHVVQMLRSFNLLLLPSQVPVPLFHAVAAVLPSRCSALPVSGLIAALQAYCYTRLNTQALSDALCTAVTQQVHQLSPDQLYRVLHALSHAKVQHSTLAKLAADMLLIHGPGRTTETADAFAQALQQALGLSLWEPDMLQRAAPKLATAAGLATAVGTSNLLQVTTGLLTSAAKPAAAAEVVPAFGEAVQRHAEVLPSQGEAGRDRLYHLLTGLEEVGAGAGVDVRQALVKAADVAVAAGGWKQGDSHVARLRTVLAQVGITWNE